MRLPKAPSSRLLRILASLLAGVALAVVGTVAGLRLAGPMETETELGRASLNIAPDVGGNVDAFVPIADWGIRADTFAAPFRLEFEVRSVDRPAAVGAASGDRAVLTGLEGELEEAARDASVRAFAWGVAVTVVLAFLLWLAIRRRPGALLIPLTAVAVSALGSALCLALAAATFDSKAFANPSFYGRGRELAQLLDFFETQAGDERYENSFEGALTNFSAYLSDTPRPGEEESTSVLFGSDLHNNGLVLPAVSRFADGRPVLLAGDFGHEGNEAEARALAPRIAELGDEVIAVSGNHDSSTMMQALVEAGVTVLGAEGPIAADGRSSGGPVIEVGDLTIAGYPDPLEWRGSDPGSPERIFSFAQMEDGEERYERAKADLVTWFEGLPSEPDIVLVHQNGLAQHLAAVLDEGGYARPLTIVTGHNHYQRIDRAGEITIINAGTLGAGGFLRLGQESVGLGQMYLAGEPPEVQSVDLIEVEPVSGAAQADRVVLDVECPPEEAEETCSYEPETSD